MIYPDPLVPSDVDLRDFGFMPLDVLRLRDSDLAALATGAEFKAAVLLWCSAWHQVPAASLPADDRLLARYSGAAAAWPKLRAGALRGFVECSDGRFYHPTIAEKALEAWAAKAAQRARTKAATEAREAKRREQHAQRDAGRDVERGEQRDVERNVVQGIGTVKGQGQGKKEKPPNPPRPDGRFAEFWQAWPKSPRKGSKPDVLKVWQAKDLDREADAILAHVRQLAGTEGWTKQGGEYVPAPIVYLRSRRWDGAEGLQQAPNRSGPPAADWRSTKDGVQTRAYQLGFGPYAEVDSSGHGVSFATYRAKVIAADEAAKETAP